MCARTCDWRSGSAPPVYTLYRALLPTIQSPFSQFRRPGELISTAGPLTSELPSPSNLLYIRTYELRRLTFQVGPNRTESERNGRSVRASALCPTSCSNGGDDLWFKHNSGMHHITVHAAIAFFSWVVSSVRAGSVTQSFAPTLRSTAAPLCK